MSSSQMAPSTATAHPRKATPTTRSQLSASRLTHPVPTPMASGTRLTSALTAALSSSIARQSTTLSIATKKVLLLCPNVTTPSLTRPAPICSVMQPPVPTSALWSALTAAYGMKKTMSKPLQLISTSRTSTPSADQPIRMRLPKKLAP